jgi:hypothetical protein
MFTWTIVAVYFMILLVLGLRLSFAQVRYFEHYRRVINPPAPLTPDEVYGGRRHSEDDGRPANPQQLLKTAFTAIFSPTNNVTLERDRRIVISRLILTIVWLALALPIFVMSTEFRL